MSLVQVQLGTFIVNTLPLPHDSCLPLHILIKVIYLCNTSTSFFLNYYVQKDNFYCTNVNESSFLETVSSLVSQLQQKKSKLDHFPDQNHNQTFISCY